MTFRCAIAGILLTLAPPAAQAAAPDPRVRQLIQTLTRESQDFVRGSGQLFSEETLSHLARADDGTGIVKHTVISHYSFAAPRDRTQAVREIRQVLTVDGKAVKKDKGLEAVASAVSSGSSDKEKLRLLEQWERYGVKTVATDLGQLLLLFTPETVVNYEFQVKGRQILGGEAVLQFSYSQLDGQGSMSVYKDGEVKRPKLAGEVWVQERDFRLLRVALFSHVPVSPKELARQELVVHYAFWPAAGCVMPAAALHREHLNGALRVENRYNYGPYKSFSSKK
jgi:hypothetical protein